MVQYIPSTKWVRYSKFTSPLSSQDVARKNQGGGKVSRKMRKEKARREKRKKGGKGVEVNKNRKWAGKIEGEEKSGVVE